MTRHLTLSLVSHTNVGKTTLARTLLRRDVGEVLDQAHVTEEAESFVLLATDDAELRLSDTPGFGDSARLLRRLRRHDQPVMWFFQQGWDRLTDRPFWCSQQAALNVRHDADIVLYLVNASEEPEDAGYVDLELELLDWLKVPVLILLNQTGESSGETALTARVDSWRRHTERFAVVRGVLPLDAYSRCWVQESLLFERVETMLDGEQRQLMVELRQAWDERNLAIYSRSVDALHRYLVRAASDRQALPSKRPSRAEKQQAMEALGRRAVHATEDLMTTLIVAHGLEGGVAARIDEQLDAYAFSGEEQVDPERGALLGGIVSGAVGGLAADVLAGGLTFGGGMLAGAILGALGGAGLARGYQLITSDRLPEVGWSIAFVDRLARQAMLRYLAVAHFGRGRGEFQEQAASQRWVDRVDDEVGRRHWGDLWSAVSGRQSGADARLRRELDAALRTVLVDGYLRAAELLDAPPPAVVDPAADSVGKPMPGEEIEPVELRLADLDSEQASVLDGDESRDREPSG